MAKQNKKSWRTSIVFETPDPEITLQFETKGAAAEFVETCVKDGGFFYDRTADDSNYDLVVFPIHRIRKFEIKEI